MEKILLEILYIRHGESYGNISHDGSVRYHPDDPPLSPKGKRQAELLAERFAGQRLDAVYASPLTRAIETIYPTAQQKNLPVRLLPDLMEVDTKIGGCESEKIAREFPLAIQCTREPTPAGGKLLLGDETDEQKQQRGMRCVKYLLEHYKNGERVAVVSHGGFFGYFVRSALGIGLDESFTWKVDNAGITSIIFRENRLPWLGMANDRAHLYQLSKY